jgi:hypothetical protein
MVTELIDMIICTQTGALEHVVNAVFRVRMVLGDTNEKQGSCVLRDRDSRLAFGDDGAVQPVLGDDVPGHRSGLISRDDTGTGHGSGACLGHTHRGGFWCRRAEQVG